MIVDVPTTVVKSTRKPSPPPKPRNAALTSAQVQDIIACAVYAVSVGAHGMELDMLRSQWHERGRNLFDIALAGACQGKEWAE